MNAKKTMTTRITGNGTKKTKTRRTTSSITNLPLRSGTRITASKLPYDPRKGRKVVKY